MRAGFSPLLLAVLLLVPLVVGIIFLWPKPAVFECSEEAHAATLAACVGEVDISIEHGGGFPGDEPAHPVSVEPGYWVEMKGSGPWQQIRPTSQVWAIDRSADVYRNIAVGRHAFPLQLVSNSVGMSKPMIEIGRDLISRAVSDIRYNKKNSLPLGVVAKSYASYFDSWKVRFIERIAGGISGEFRFLPHFVSGEPQQNSEASDDHGGGGGDSPVVVLKSFDDIPEKDKRRIIGGAIFFGLIFVFVLAVLAICPESGEKKGDSND